MVLTDQLFHQFSDLVYRECGINLHEGKKALLQARLNKRLRITGFSSYEQYYEHITSSGNCQEFIHFLDSISTNLTYFFRESQHFEFLEQKLPEVLEAKRKEKNLKLRIWSAGCSTGEEPYSIAMCVLPHLEGLPRFDFRILATDISTRALKTAVRGVYSEEKIAKVPEALRIHHFRNLQTQNGKREFEVIPAVRHLITFGRLNLKDPFPFKGPFDFIFCRNVMIYFDKKTQELLVQKIAQYLDPGGYLFVGHSESLMGLSHSLRYVRPAVYRR
ncbi:MAG: protein-glutamate O-methyltransferase CheR [Syntrophobacteraceae bacterium]|nr:protein-glutamate O-methyltransferase CheR [Syntrophobacteraceae bacterium]